MEQKRESKWTKKKSEWSKKQSLDRFVEFVSKTADAYFRVGALVLHQYFTQQVVKEQLGVFLGDKRLQVLILTHLGGEIKLFTYLGDLVLEGQAIAYLKKGQNVDQDFHIVNLGDLSPSNGEYDIAEATAQAELLQNQILGAKIIRGKELQVLDQIIDFEEKVIENGLDFSNRGDSTPATLNKCVISELKETEGEQAPFEEENSLSRLGEKLRVTEKEASDKLEQLIIKEKEAENQREAYIKLSAEIDAKQGEIQGVSMIVEQELSQAEPALRRAEKSVSNITLAQINTIKSYKTPPKKVMMTMEAVCLLMTKKRKDWKGCRQEMQKKDFISNILNFDTDSISPKLKEKLLHDYINDPKWEIKGIKKAAYAAGALAEWLTSQLKFADIMAKIDPLRNEVKSMRASESSLIEKRDELEKRIGVLEQNIETYEKEYESLIAKVGNIKTEMEDIEKKATNSESLLINLSSDE